MLKKMIKDVSKNIEYRTYKKEYLAASQGAEYGNKHSQFLLAQMYENGTPATDKDILSAYVWYYFAYQNGQKDAHRHLLALESQLTTEQLANATDIISKNMHYIYQKTNLLGMIKRLFS